MFLNIKKFILLITIILFGFVKNSYAERINDIKITGNDRIPKETIVVFSNVSINDEIDSSDLNEILKNLYNTNFFKDVSVGLTNNTLNIKVIENPIIEKISFEGIKSNRIKDLISKNMKLKSRSSYNELFLKIDQQNIKNQLKELGYYFPIIETYIEDLKDNKISINYKINMGDKAKIKKISFIGNKIFKDKKLKSIIISEENKFWKFITNKKYVNERIITLEKRLLKNFYLNKGY